MSFFNDMKIHLKFLFIPSKISERNIANVEYLLFHFRKKFPFFFSTHSKKHLSKPGSNKNLPLSFERDLEEVFISDSQQCIILTSYFCSKNDPQRNQFEKPDNFEYLENWYDSIINLNLKALVFHDSLSPQFVQKKSNSNIKFCKVVLGNYSLNDERFFVYNTFINKNKNLLKKIILTDINDVEIFKNPFNFVRDEKIYIGLESKNRIFHSAWAREKLSLFLESSGLSIKKQFLLMPFFNAGVIGGKTATISNLVNSVCMLLSLCNDERNHNMIAINYTIFKYFTPPIPFYGVSKFSSEKYYQGKILFAGYPFVSEFKKYQKSDGFYIKHK